MHHNFSSIGHSMIFKYMRIIYKFENRHFEVKVQSTIDNKDINELYYNHLNLQTNYYMSLRIYDL